jgi:hypothetical protein
VRRGVFGINVKFQTWGDNLGGERGRERERERERFVALGFRLHRKEDGWESRAQHKHEHEMSAHCREKKIEWNRNHEETCTLAYDVKNPLPPNHHILPFPPFPFPFPPNKSEYKQ